MTVSLEISITVDNGNNNFLYKTATGQVLLFLLYVLYLLAFVFELLLNVLLFLLHTALEKSK